MGALFCEEKKHALVKHNYGMTRKLIPSHYKIKSLNYFSHDYDKNYFTIMRSI